MHNKNNNIFVQKLLIILVWYHKRLSLFKMYRLELKAESFKNKTKKNNFNFSLPLFNVNGMM